MAPRVFIGMPSYNGQVHFSSVQALLACSAKGHCVASGFVKSSLLAKCFNMLWCNALNDKKAHGLTHFCMLHADIGPDNLWLDKMLEIMEGTGADILSAVVPIKTNEGLTSTGIFTDDPFIVKRFTMNQIHAMPETFSHPRLALNTGLMLVNLNSPRVEELYFTIADRKIVTSEGAWEAQALSEDWGFSKMAHDIGLKLFATRAIGVRHHGDSVYTNTEAWGSLSFDEINGIAKLD